MKIIDRSFNLRGKHVTVMGFGTKNGGSGTIEFLHNKGAEITVTDLLTEAYFGNELDIHRGKIQNLRFGYHDINDFISADLIIKNEGIKRNNEFISAALEHGIPVETPAGLFSILCNQPYIGITGTKGKTFTTELTAHILNYCGIHSIAAGNNCVNPLRCLNSDLFTVLELSSWQLHEFALHEKSPHIACWLNFFNDHMNYYDSIDEYFFDKKAITVNQNKNDIFILPFDEVTIGNVKTKAEKYFFSSNPLNTEKIPQGIIIKNNKFYFKKDITFMEVLNISELPECISEKHFKDLIAAALCCSILSGADPEKAGHAVCSFKGVAHRYEKLREKNGILFINDSAATTPQSVLLALESLNSFPAILICGGGNSKNLDLSIIIESICKKIEMLILFENDSTSEIILDMIKTTSFKNIVKVQSMDQAVISAYSYLLKYKRGTVILSPSCAGSPFFTDIYERGNLFKNSIINLY